MEFGHRTKMEKNTEVKAGGRDVAAELTASAFGKPFGGLQFNDDATFDEYVDTMRTDLLIAESDGDWVFAINLKPSTS